ncbi:MAG: hypothetical protein IKQ47_07295 [Prevotella sp.]|nr:hypothetical protein [Prevotella sp.]
MKNIFTYLTVVAVMLLVSCSSDSIVADGEMILEEGTMATKPSLESGDASRSALFLKDGKMMFEWRDTDKIAVYPMYKEGTNQDFNSIDESMMKKLMYRRSTTNSVDLDKAEFSINDEKYILDVKNTRDYVAWAPLLEGPAFTNRIVPELGYTEMPVVYNGQIQASNVEMGHYVTTDNTEMAAYMASEKAASAHLGTFDYLYAQGNQGMTGYTCFNFSHLQATIRFYMVIPEPDKPQVFDSLIIYHKHDAGDIAGYNFVTKGRFNLDTKSMTVDEIASKLTLKLGTETEGMDLIDHEVGSDTEGEYKSVYKRGDRYFLIAYMQMYPVNITMDNMQKPTLYLCGHTGSEATGDLKKNFYKARLDKKNILAGKWYQWATSLDEDQPIEFEVVSVQEWEADDTLYNTVNKQEGQGTQDW